MSMLENPNWFHLIGRNTGGVDVKMDGCILEENIILKDPGIDSFF